MNQRFGQFCRFVCTGSYGTAIQYAILALLVEMCGTHAVIASTIGFVVAATLNYMLNRRFTFESSARHVVAFPKFLTVAVLGAVMNAAVVGWFEAHTELHYLASQVCATMAVLFWNFTANAAWTFKRVS